MKQLEDDEYLLLLSTAETLAQAVRLFTTPYNERAILLALKMASQQVSKLPLDVLEQHFEQTKQKQLHQYRCNSLQIRKSGQNRDYNLN